MADISQEPDAADDGGGPVKSFLEHLEDFRWLLIKSVVALSVTMLVCLIGANHVIGDHQMAADARPGQLSGHQPRSSPSISARTSWAIIHSRRNSNSFFTLGTNRFVAVVVEPLTVGTNQILAGASTTIPPPSPRRSGCTLTWST